MESAYVLELGVAGYREAWDLQRALSAGVGDGSLPDTVILVEHPPVVTLGRRTEADELHIPREAEVEIVETDRGEDVIAIRPIMNLTLTYDHRLVDGALAGRFLRDLREKLQTWDEAAY